MSRGAEMIFFDPVPVVEGAVGALVVADDAAERESLTGMLATHFRVQCVSYEAAGTTPARDAPEVVVIGWRSRAPRAIQRIRACAATRHAHIVALAEAPDRASVLSMYEAGVDDFVRRPVVQGELLARVGLPTGSSVWKCERDRTTPESAEPPELSRCEAFTQMAEVVAAELSEMLGELTIADGWLVAGATRAASLSLAIASESAEIRVSVIVDAALTHGLAQALLGDADSPAEALEDMLREIVNTAAGAVKRAAAAEEIVATTGLPSSKPLGEALTEETRCWTLRVEGAGMQLGLIGEIVRHGVQRLRLGEVRVGMVVSRDVRDAAGALLAPCGTLINATTRARIEHSLGRQVVIDVIDPAPKG